MRKLTFAALVAVVCACAPNPGPVYFKNVTLLTRGAGCTAPNPNDNGNGGGLLDLAGGSVAYFVGVVLESQVTTPEVTAAGTVIESSDRDVPVIDTVTYTYTTTPKTGTFKPEPVKMSGVFPRGAGATLSLPFNVIGPLAAVNIAEGDFVTTTPGDSFVLNSSFEFSGHMSGSNAPFKTGTMTFPVRIIKSACTPAGPPADMDVTCGVVQDKRACQ